MLSNIIISYPDRVVKSQAKPIGIAIVTYCYSVEVRYNGVFASQIESDRCLHLGVNIAKSIDGNH